MTIVGYYFGKGFQDEAPQVHAGMRQREFGGINDLVVIKDEVNIHRTAAV